MEPQCALLRLNCAIVDIFCILMLSKHNDMPKKGDTLHRLIHRLTAPEKRYFKLFIENQSRASKDSSFAKLYDRLEEMPEYDNKSLDDEFKNLNHLKNYLQRKLLIAMSNYQEESSTQWELQDAYRDAVFFHSKGIYKESLSKIEEALTKAIQEENFTVALDLSAMKIKAVLATESKALPKKLEACLQVEAEIMARQAQLIFMRNTYQRVFAIHRMEAGTRDQQSLETLQALVSDPRFIEPDGNGEGFFFCRHYYFLTLATLASIKRDAPSAYHYYQQILLLWRTAPMEPDAQPGKSSPKEKRTIKATSGDQKPAAPKLHPFAIQKPGQYKLVLYNYLNVCHTYDQYDQFETILGEVRALPSASPDEEAETFQNTSMLEMLYYMNLGQLDRAIQMVGPIKSGLQSYEGKVTPSRKATIMGNIAIAYFLDEQWDNAAKWTKEIIDGHEIRFDIAAFARTIQLLIDFSRARADKDLISMEYTLRNSKRELKLRKRYDHFEELVFRQVGRLIASASQQAAAAELATLHKKLKEMLDATNDGEIYGLREIFFWADSRIRNVKMILPFQEYIQNKKRKA